MHFKKRCKPQKQIITEICRTKNIKKCILKTVKKVLYVPDLDKIVYDAASRITSVLLGELSEN